MMSLLATPTQEDVFRSISDNVGGEMQPGKFLLVLGSVIGLIVLLALLNRRKLVVRSPQALNHQGKLIKEVLRSVPLKSGELKQLRLIAAQAETEEPLASPLTLILCPSVMARTVQTKRLKLDPKALASVARKAGLAVTRR